MVAATVPKVTRLAPVRCVPLTVTTVSPTVGPLDGVTEETVGAGTTKVKAVALATVPCVVSTVTATVPAAWAGVSATSLVVPVTRKVGAALHRT